MNSARMHFYSHVVGANADGFAKTGQSDAPNRTAAQSSAAFNMVSYPVRHHTHKTWVYLWWRWAMLPCLGVATLLLSPALQAQTTSIASVKAGLIYRFVQFTQWPRPSTVDNQPMLYCVVGDAQVFDALGLLFSDANRQQGIARRWVTTPDQLRDCHVVYFSSPATTSALSSQHPSVTTQNPSVTTQNPSVTTQSASSTAKEHGVKATAIWRPYLQQSHAITIGDGAEWFRQGTLFGIITEPNRLSFRVNLTKAREQGFHLSAQMLKLAKEIH